MIMTIAPKTPNSIKSGGSSASAPPVENRAMQILNGPDMQARLRSLLTEKSMLDRFIGVLTGVMKANSKLAECTPDSLVGAMLKSAFLKLEPNNPITQQCWLIPRKNGKTGKYECSWEIGYKGLIELAYRSNVVASILFSEIHERDYFDVDFGSGIVNHKIPDKDDPNRFNRGDVRAYWAQWIGKNGERGRPVIMSIEEMEAFAEQYVQSLKGEGREYSPWYTAFDQMALKTVIKRALKSAPISTEDYRRALENDGMATSGKDYGMPEKALKSGTADILSAPPSEFVEAEYEVQTEPKPDAKAVADMTPAPVSELVIDEEKHRLDTLAKVLDRINELNLTPDKVLEKTGMPMSMLKRATTADLLKAYKAIQG